MLHRKTVEGRKAGVQVFGVLAFRVQFLGLGVQVCGVGVGVRERHTDTQTHSHTVTQSHSHTDTRCRFFFFDPSSVFYFVPMLFFVTPPRFHR